MKFYRYIVCAFLFIGAAIAETININWINGDETYAQTTCEIGGDIILPTTPTKRGHTFVGWASYTRLEYIESTGMQYIDTGIKVNDFEYFEAYAGISSTHRFPELFGASVSQAAGADNSKVVRLAEVDYSGVMSIAIGETWIQTHKTLSSDSLYTIEGTIKSGTQIVAVDGVDIVRGGIYFGLNNNYNIYLFNLNYGNRIQNHGGARIGHISFSNAKNVVRNFIAVRRNIDGVVGMYDTVTQTFFTNPGTGEFIAGPVAENQSFDW